MKQVQVGEIVKVRNHSYHMADVGIGRVVAVSATGSTVEMVESTRQMYPVGSRIRFNLNKWTDTVIIHQRGASVGSGLWACINA